MERDEERGTQHGSNSWNRFLSTGRVDDYLRYRGCMDDAISVRNGTERSIGNGGTGDLDRHDISGFSC